MWDMQPSPLHVGALRDAAADRGGAMMDEYEQAVRGMKPEQQEKPERQAALAIQRSVAQEQALSAAVQERIAAMNVARLKRSA